MPNKLTSLEGYVLSSVKYKDKDSLITLMAKDKLYSIKIRNGYDVANKNHSATLVFNKIIIDSYQSEMGYLSASGVQTVENHTSLYEKILPNLIGQLCSEIVLKCFGEGDELPYEFYSSSLKELESGFDPLTIGFIFSCQGIKQGIAPEINECVNCGTKKGLVSFSYDEGGFLCASCAKEANYPVMDTNYLKVIRYGYLVTPDKIAKAVLPKAPLSRALEDTIKALEEQLGAQIKSYKLLKEANF